VVAILPHTLLISNLPFSLTLNLSFHVVLSVNNDYFHGDFLRLVIAWNDRKWLTRDKFSEICRSMSCYSSGLYCCAEDTVGLCFSEMMVSTYEFTHRHKPKEHRKLQLLEHLKLCLHPSTKKHFVGNQFGLDLLCLGHVEGKISFLSFRYKYRLYWKWQLSGM
jgi:hypothetical protein